MSTYHTSFGYTTMRISEAEEKEFDVDYTNRMDLNSKKFLGRADFVEFTSNEEILIKDDFGIHIIYDCVETDMDMLKDEILLTGSFFIKTQEPLMDAENTEKLTPIIDRISTLESLMKFEAKYHFKKALLVRLYMEAYEHIVDPLEQKRFIQFIANMMAERPRLNLDSYSFENSYKLELHILDKKLEFLKNIVQFQISTEHKVNGNICDSLEKAHKLINENINGKWKYYRTEDINEELEKRGLEKKRKRKADVKFGDKKVDKNNPVTIDLAQVPSNIDREKSPSKKDQQKLFKKNRRGLIGLEEEPEDRFSKVLGLPKIGQEEIYKKYRENDQEAIDIMNEQSSFIQNEEANPRRFNNKEYCLDTYMSGDKIGILDFYESLSNIHWVHNMMEE